MEIFSTPADDFEVNDIYYKILSKEDLTCEVTGKDYGRSGTIVIPSTVAYNGKTYSVTSIGEEAFWRCSGLTSVTIPTSVTSIGRWAFRDCFWLTSITIPNSVTSIGERAFAECHSLASITLGNSVTSIGESAFWGCFSLTSVTIPNSVTSIGAWAFSCCSGLTSVISKMENPCNLDINSFPNMVNKNATLYVPKGTIDLYKSTDYWKMFASIEEGDGPNGGDIDYDSFEVDGIYYKVLSKEDMTCEVTKAANKTRGENDYSGDIVIPSTATYNGKAFSVTSIGDGAFAGCDGLTSITIPSSVTNIGEQAFAGCTGLTSITLEMEHPCNIDASCFDGVDLGNVTLYVPEGSSDLYKSADVWNNFNSIKEGNGSNADGIEGLKISDGEITVYDLKGAAVYQGRKAEMPKHLKGLYIVKLGGKAVKCRL